LERKTTHEIDNKNSKLPILMLKMISAGDGVTDMSMNIFNKLVNALDFDSNS
jgi:hypothetical protein